MCVKSIAIHSLQSVTFVFIIGQGQHAMEQQHMMSQILNAQALAYDPAVVPYDREQGLDSSLNENAQVFTPGQG